MDKRWVFNASPVILLAKAQVIHFVPRLCAQLVIPADVVTEVHRGQMSDAGRAWLNNAGAAFVRPSVTVPEAVARLRLGGGESQVLAWVTHNPGFEGVLDDLKARRSATELGLPRVGSLRVLIILKEQGLIPAVRPALDRFREAGSYLSEGIVQQALELTNEL